MNESEKKLLTSVWALTALSLVSLVLTRELELATICSILLIAPIGFYFESIQKLVKVRWLENSLILLFFFGSVFRLIFLSSPFLNVVADFLVAFTLLKLSFKKDSKDLMQIIALSFFLLLSTSTLALDFTFLLCFILYVLMATWTLSLYTLTPVDSKIERPSEKSDERKNWWSEKISKPLLKNCWITLGLAIFFSISIFIFFPRLSLAVFQGTFLGTTYKTGYTESVNLARPGKIVQDPMITMRVEIDPADKNKNWRWLLRGNTLSYFNGKEWIAGPKKEKISLGDSYKSRFLKIQKLIKTQFRVMEEEKKLFQTEFGLKINSPNSYLRQKIYLESIDTQILFGVPRIESVTARLPKISVMEDGSLYRPNNFNGRISYEVNSLIEEPSDKILFKNSVKEKNLIKKEVATNKQGKIALNLQLPDHDFSQVQKLVGKIVSAKDSSYLKAKKIERYLRENYSYTLDMEPKNVANPLDYFLFDSKKGNCEYFASAMALMLRLEQIPTRIVAGFVMSEWNQNGNYYIVRAKDAHSWVECYLNGLWIEFDPTPRIAPIETKEPSFWASIKQEVDYLNFLWNAHVLSYDVESQKKLVKTVELKSNRLSMQLDKIVGKWRAKLGNQKGIGQLMDDQNEKKPVKTAENGTKSIFKGKIFKIISLFVISVLVIGYAANKKLMLYFKFLGDKTENKHKKIGQFYFEMLKIFSKYGFNKKRGETPYEFAYRVGHEINQSNSALFNKMFQNLMFLTDLFYKIRFSVGSFAKQDFAIIQNSLKELQNVLPQLKQ